VRSAILAEQEEEIDQSDRLRNDIKRNLKKENDIQREKVLEEKRRREQENIDFVQDERMIGREKDQFASKADIATQPGIAPMLMAKASENQKDNQQSVLEGITN